MGPIRTSKKYLSGIIKEKQILLKPYKKRLSWIKSKAKTNMGVLKQPVCMEEHAL
jgi:hypothetical protein